MAAPATESTPTTPKADMARVTTTAIATTAATMEVTAAAPVARYTRVVPPMAACLVDPTTTRLQLTPQPSMLATPAIRTCSALPLACSQVTRHSRKTLMKMMPSDSTSNSTVELVSLTQPALAAWARPPLCRLSRCSTREAARLETDPRARTTLSVLPCPKLLSFSTSKAPKATCTSKLQSRMLSHLLLRWPSRCT
ncbi:unnamed protein product [Aureobasidium uvarum]|uniref:Uncharacterized protein n=1 Tax=Aureobasidium uvarum TaxID=2773716 RepID=A0A9N8KLH5_9PEZI|nr:unnamed protein product [Aureobasidium uvarum]